MPIADTFAKLALGAVGIHADPTGRFATLHERLAHEALTAGLERVGKAIKSDDEKGDDE